MKWFFGCLWLLVVSGVGLAGCGTRPSLGKVSGTVSFKGQPIQNGTIIFEVTGARPATGKIVDGQIREVTTVTPDDGVNVGAAKIAVFATEGEAGEDTPAVGATPGIGFKKPKNYMGMNVRSLISLRYNDPEASGLRLEVKKGANVLKIDLTEGFNNRQR